MAIIKNHALDRRFDIEPRILQADFEVSNACCPHRHRGVSLIEVPLNLPCRLSRNGRWNSILRLTPILYMSCLAKMRKTLQSEAQMLPGWIPLLKPTPLLPLTEARSGYTCSNAAAQLKSGTH